MKGLIMLGIEDKGVMAAYLLCIVSAILCVVYGLINWSRGDDSVEPDDVKWAIEEQKVEDKI
ncbi:MAG: hypothetical protein ISS71_07660 [Phycisphaerae bacterium]|nr:hypothetical protein [Phycisphaerae bacterium]